MTGSVAGPGATDAARGAPADAVVRLAFVFTDIEGSTRQLERLGAGYGEVLATHAELVRHALDAHRGREVDTQGDAFFAVFAHAAHALAFAADIQARLAAHPWPQGATVRLRIGIHAGEAIPTRTGFVGMDVHLAARIAAAAHGGQVLVSRAVADGVAAVGPDPAAQDLPPLRSLGTFTLKDIRGPVELLEVELPGTPADLPPPRTLDEVIEPPTPGDPPYPGLVAFEEADAGRFFGRETLVTELADRLDAAPFLAVVGASGSGKSSVVRAGLVPALRARLAAPEGDPGAHEPRVVLLTPTEDPVAELVAALGGLGGPPDAVVVDQFEELFTVCRDDAARNAFVDRLLALLDAGSRVVVVLRADLYDRLAAFDRLRSLASEHQAYLGPMSPAELRRAIEGPAEAGGWQLDPGLVDLIIGDLGDEPGGLPLLSHALRETWERRWGTRLTLRGYLDSGGVQGAIARTADRVVETLQGADLARTRAIFLRLTELGSETPDTRRRAPIAELVHARDDAADRRVLDRLVAARLVVADDRTVEVAHEALIREWPLLREWLEEDREAIRLRRAVTDAATDWERAGADPSHLLRGARLAAVSEWLRARPDDASDLERRFVTASVAAAEAETAEREAARQRELDAARRAADAERARADEAARSARRTRRAAAALVGLLVAAVGLAGYAVIQSRRADEQRQVAEDQTRVAEQQTDAAQEQRGIADSRELAQAAGAQLETDPELSVLLGLAALDTARTAEADRALRDAVEASHIRRVIPGAPDAYPLSLASDGSQLLTADAAGAIALSALGADGAPDVRTLGTADPGYAGRVASDGRAVTLAGPDIAIWEPGSETPRMLRTGLPGAVSLALDADGSRIAVGGQVPVVGTSDNLQVWDAASGTLLRSIRSGDFTLNTVALSPDGELVAASGWDRVIRVWRVATGELVHTLRGHTSLVLTTAFSPDGGLLASGGYDAIVRTWNVATGDMLAEARGHTAPVELVAFDPTGLRVVSSSDDGTVRIWDAIDGTPGPVLRGSQGGVADARFGPTDGEVTSVGWDGVTRIWADDPDRPLATARGHGNEVWQVDLDAVGDRFATASIDHTARVWDAATGAAISTFHGHQAEVFSATMSPDGTRAVSGDTTGAVWVWDAATGDPIRQLADGLGVIRRVAFSPDGAQVAAAGDEGIWVWDAQTGAQGLALTEPSHIVAFDPEGTRLLVTDGDTEARLLDAASGSLLRALSGHTGTVTDGRFDRTGTLVVTASSEGTARVWDATTGVSLVELRAPAEAGATNSADISPDATRVVTGQDDGSVIVWDASSGEPLVTFRGDAGQVLSVRFGPDGRRIMVAGASEAVARVFGCDLCGTTDEVVALAGSRVTRSLTEDERSRFLHEPATPASPSVGPVGSPEPTGAAGSAEPSVAPSTGMEPTPEPSPQPTAPPSPAPSPMPSVDPLGQALCAGRRESCLLAPGRYHASLFDPPLSFDVGDGWSNDYVTPRTITLSRQDGSALVTLYSAPTDGLLVGRVVAVGPGPQGLFDHLRRWYGLTVSDAVPVDVDGHPGISVDIVNRLDRDLEVLQVDEGTEYIAARGRAHWIALDVDGTTVLLTIATDEAPAGGVPPEAQALIGSLRFDPSGAGLAGGPATSPPPG